MYVPTYQSNLFEKCTAHKRSKYKVFSMTLPMKRIGPSFVAVSQKNTGILVEQPG